MKPITQFRFSDLPTELALSILRFAARPTFDQAEKYEAKCPYSSALALCLVSTAFRRAVLPELLHTILLRDSRNVRQFVQALLMQKEYAEEEHAKGEYVEQKIKNRLHFEYAPHVHKIWIGCHVISAHLPTTPRAYALKPPERPLAISLLTPLLLAAPSLALDWTSMDLLVECLEHAWTSYPATHVSDKHSPSPWKTQTLTLSGGVPTSDPRWKRLTDTPQGSAFLASISHLSTTTYLCRDFEPLPPSTLPKDYRLPLWMQSEDTPWACFKNLQTVILPYPRTNPPIRLFALLLTGIDMHVELLTLSASLLKDPCDGIPKTIKAFAEIGPGEECIRSDNTRLKMSRFPIRWYSRDGWAKVWACML
ncbi:hypothetical protein EDB19DRAFT_309766 [Suillus lakei]|nr:hypothetical protein EDB19DRAFT_309766 [Suillus lakei]